MIVPFTPLSSEATRNISAFIAHYRALVSELPHVDTFEEDNWDLRGAGALELISCGDKRCGLLFTKLSLANQRDERRTLEQPLRDVAKAFALRILAQKAPKSRQQFSSLLQVIKYQEAHLLQRGLPASPEFLTPDLLDEVNLAIRSSGKAPSTTKTLCLALNQLVKDQQEAGMIRMRFTWSGIVVKHQICLNRVGSEFEQARQDMLPTENEMQAVGHVFRHATLSRQRYVAAMAAILSGLPGRIGEVLTLPVDCEFDDERNGKKLYRIRWRPEKGAPPMTKDSSYATHPWIPHYKKALAWLREISEPARQMATWYEANPTRIHLPEHLEPLRVKEWLTLIEVAEILQLRHEYPAYLVPLLQSRKIPVQNKSYGKGVVRFADVERFVLSELPSGFPIYHRASGLKYSEALCLIREHEFVGNRKFDTSPSHTMFKKPNLGLVKRLLNQAFDDFELINEEGKPVRLNTHEFRHRWCTKAEEAGIWRSFNNAMSGRLKVSQANNYDHMTADYVLQVTAEMIKDDGRIFGEILAFTPQEPFYLHEVERQIEELAMLKAIVVTPYGICVNDFVASPCEYHLDCLNCRNHACVKGLPVRTENIRKRLALQEKSLALARKALENGDYGVEDHLRDTLEPNVQRLRAIVTILDDPRFKLGTEITLAHGPQNHPITKALQIRIDTLKAKGLDTAAEESMVLPPEKSFYLNLVENP